MIGDALEFFWGAQAACLHQLAASQRGLNGPRGKLPQSAGWVAAATAPQAAKTDRVRS
jgi:hypothetical protein